MAINISLPKLSLEGFSTTARADYRFAPFNALLLVSLMLIGLGVHVAVYEFRLFFFFRTTRF